MLRRQTSLLRWLNALDASARRMASIAGLSTSARIAWIAASISLSCPAHSGRLPTASQISSPIIYMYSTAFPMICRSTSPIPIGLTPGFLSRGTRQHDKNPSREEGLTKLVAKHREHRAIASHRRSEVSPNWYTCGARIQHHRQMVQRYQKCAVRLSE